jgi:hypothetical protein
VPSHVAIVVAPYDRLILEGRKTIECRLTQNAGPPFGRITPGDRIYFKRSGGPFFAAAVADRVWMTDSLTPRAVDELRKRFDGEIHGAPEYWRSRRGTRYGTLIWLREVRPCGFRPKYKPQNMRAWYVIDDAVEPTTESRPVAQARKPPAPSFRVKLSAGSLRQSQLRLAGVLDRFPAEALGGATKRNPGAPITLRLLGIEPVVTDIVADKKMFRWRGWAAWFNRHGLGPGDHVRFTARGGRAFTVEPDKA